VATLKAPTEETRRQRPAKLRIVDCDVHNALPSKAALKPYLAEKWHVQFDAHPKSSMHGVNVGARPHHGIFRDDSFPPDGSAPGSDLLLLREQLLDRFDIARAILSPLEGLEWVQYGRLGHALAAALNDYIRAEWLEQDARLFAAISVPTEDSQAAVEEIHRIAELDRRFVGVLMLIGSREPLGHPKYWPIYEAAVEHGLPVVAHVGGFSGTTSSVGSVSYQVGRHAVWPSSYQAHVISLVTSGVFTHLPELQFVLEEGGFTWLPSLMWRLDRTAAMFREQFPQLKGQPSDVIREHFYFTTQPIDEPEQPAFMTQTIEQLGMADRIMFATDYPHWDFDPPDRVLRTEVSAEVRQKIFASNAEALYPFPSA
jgi:predicted TIM-barrel fold metal-dependent hydrolase